MSVEMKRLNASGLKAAGYDEGNRKLVVETTAGTFEYANISPEDKNDVIAFSLSMQEEANAGGDTLGNLGPVTEGLFAWIVGIGALIGCAVWLGAKAA